MPTTKRTKRKTRAKTAKNEKLLCTCSTLLDRGTVRSIADDLLGKMLQSSSSGKYYQVMSTRVSGYKIYGQCEEMEESGYAFSPVKQSTLFE